MALGLECLLLRPRLLWEPDRLRLCDDEVTRRRGPSDVALRDEGGLPQPGQRPHDHHHRRRPWSVRVRTRLGPHGRTLPRPRPLLHRAAALEAPVTSPIATRATLQLMCLSIKVLRRPDEPATTGEIEPADRQLV